MSPNEEKAKRRPWRPRFSVKTLGIVVTLICAYFGTWEATNQAATKMGWEWSSPMPFVIQKDLYVVEERSNGLKVFVVEDVRYSLWLFGPTIELFEQESQATQL